MREKSVLCFLLLCFSVSAAITGCAAVPLYWHAPQAKTPAAGALSDGLQDFAGVIHIHTTPYSSDASGTLEHAVRVARRQHLDYLLITEHNTLRGYETGREGFYGKTLVLISEELSTRAGHFLALGVPHHVSRYQPTRRIIDEVEAVGGLGFVPHPFWRRKRWTMWDPPQIVGMEIYNVAHVAMEENRIRLLISLLLMPPDWFYQSVEERPIEALQLWDRLTQKRRFVGIGGADAHEIRVFGLTLGPYEMLFRMVRTHVKAPALTAEAVYTALREGHAYISLEMEASASGFTFLVTRHGERAGMMGDELTWEPGLQLAVSVPETARIMLLRDGHVVATILDRLLTYPADQPGVYRVEVDRLNRPWIFSNPIYLRVPKPPGAPPLEEAPHVHKSRRPPAAS